MQLGNLRAPILPILSDPSIDLHTPIGRLLHPLFATILEILQFRAVFLLDFFSITDYTQTEGRKQQPQGKGNLK